MNPYEAPRARGVRGPAAFGSDDAESIRRAHLGREAAVRSLGSLCTLVAVLSFFLAVLFTLRAAGKVGHGSGPDPGRSFDAAAGAVMAGVCLLSAALSHGLDQLQGWARRTFAALLALQVAVVAGDLLLLVIRDPAGFPAGHALSDALLIADAAVILYLLLSPRGGVVFSRAYRAIVARTPDVGKPAGLRAMIASWWFAALIVNFFVLAWAGNADP